MRPAWEARSRTCRLRRCWLGLYMRKTDHCQFDSTTLQDTTALTHFPSKMLSSFCTSCTTMALCKCSEVIGSSKTKRKSHKCREPMHSYFMARTADVTHSSWTHLFADSTQSFRPSSWSGYGRHSACAGRDQAACGFWRSLWKHTITLYSVTRLHVRIYEIHLDNM